MCCVVMRIVPSPLVLLISFFLPKPKIPDGQMQKLHRAVAESPYCPQPSDWDNHILEDYTDDALLAREQKSVVQRKFLPPAGYGEGTTRKGMPVDQLDLATHKLIRTWKSANAAATALQLTQYMINNCCIGKVRAHTTTSIQT